MAGSNPPPSPLRVLHEARTVGLDRAFVWYTEAMRLYKRDPLRFSAMALAIVAAELLLNALPVLGGPATNLLIPLAACGLLYACLACDRGEGPRVRHLLAPFAAPLPAIGTVILASIAVFGVEALVGWQLGVDLLASPPADDVAPATVLAIYGAGVAASLPLTLVPMIALFEGAGARDAFATSVAAFLRNVPAFLLYGALSIALLGLAFVTLGLALLIVLPLWAASSYAAWKDLFGIH